MDETVLPEGGAPSESRQDLQTTLKTLDKLIAMRNATLSRYEEILIQRLFGQDFSLLSASSHKKKAIQAVRELASLQLECKILRRNVFLLNQRKRLLTAKLEKLSESSEQVNASGEDLAQSL